MTGVGYVGLRGVLGTVVAACFMVEHLLLGVLVHLPMLELMGQLILLVSFHIFKI